MRESSLDDFGHHVDGPIRERIARIEVFVAGLGTREWGDSAQTHQLTNVVRVAAGTVGAELHREKRVLGGDLDQDAVTIGDRLPLNGTSTERRQRIGLSTSKFNQLGSQPWPAATRAAAAATTSSLPGWMCSESRSWVVPRSKYRRASAAPPTNGIPAISFAAPSSAISSRSAPMMSSRLRSVATFRHSRKCHATRAHRDLQTFQAPQPQAASGPPGRRRERRARSGIDSAQSPIRGRGVLPRAVASPQGRRGRHPRPDYPWTPARRGREHL